MRYARTARPGALATRSMYHYGTVARDGRHIVEYTVRRTGDHSRVRNYWFTWAWEPGKVVAIPASRSQEDEA
jgi:hypothetical protein